MQLFPIFNEDDEHVVFFTAGNPEVHRILISFGRSEEQIFHDVARSFRVSCILADLVLQSSSNYYESNITRRLVQSFLPLFYRGLAQFVIRKDHGDFYTDREAAREGYPKTADYSGYFGRKGDVRLRELSSLGFVHYRSGKMGTKIDMLWEEGLVQRLPDEEILQQIRSESRLNTTEKDKLISLLQCLPKERNESAFVWDFVESETAAHGFSIPRTLNKPLRLYLLRTYFRAASDLYTSASVLVNPSQYLGDVIREKAIVNVYSPDLFLSFCDTLGLRPIIERMTADEIIQFKNMLEFVPFRQAYFKIVDKAKSIENAKLALLHEFMGENLQRNLFRYQSFDVLLHSLKTLMGNPLVSRYNDAFTQLRATLADPSNIPFVLMQDAILAKYGNQLDQLVDEHSRGQHLRSTLGVTNIAKMEVLMGDKYDVGQAGAVGPQSHAHDMNFTQIWQKSSGKIDLSELASQLATLRQALIPLAKSGDEAIDIGLVAQAEKEASSGNGPKALEILSKASKWTLGIAEKIGVGVAVAAIKTACGL